MLGVLFRYTQSFKLTIMKNIHLLASALLAFCFTQCSQNFERKFEIANELSFERSTEVVTITEEMIGLSEGQQLENFGVFDEQGNLQLVQFEDVDNDNVADNILFQPSIPANGKATFYLRELNGKEQIQSDNKCYSRFVPERTDDYTWENDKVAFRMYGPTAQQLVETGQKGGTLSSGVDCWLKKVEYPVIDKWYAENVESPGAYHIDTGEGLDNFHVGTSRGCGGLAVFSDDSLYTSKNYTAYETTANGYIRTAFNLDFEPWKIGEDKTIKTKKSITLDRGNQLSKFEVSVEGADQITAGLTLHENDGEITVDSLSGWVSYWQPHGDTYLATAILAAPGTFLGSKEVISEVADQSNAYVSLSVQGGKAEYYAGFFWVKSGQFKTVDQWHDYLKRYATQLETPLAISLINK